MTIQKWNREMEKLLASMPRGYWLFAASGDLCVMRLSKDGERMMDGSSYSKSGLVRQLETGEVGVDGGDW